MRRHISQSGGFVCSSCAKSIEEQIFTTDLAASDRVVYPPLEDFLSYFSLQERPVASTDTETDGSRMNFSIIQARDKKVTCDLCEAIEP